MKILFLGFLAALLCASGVTAQVSPISAQWQPNSGDSVGLSPLEVTNLDSVISGGFLEVSVSYAGGMSGEAVFAYAVDYGGGRWYEAGTRRYFEVPARLVTVDSGTRETAVARIPLRMEGWADLNPNSGDEVQALHVWAGRSDSMVVDPVFGVTGEKTSSSYAVTTSIPTYSIIPDSRTIVDGVRERTSDLGFTIIRRDATSDSETFTLSYSGPEGLIEALSLPAKVTIPADDVYGDATFSFDADLSSHWPASDCTLHVIASSGAATVETSLTFSGSQLAWLGTEDFEGEPYQDPERIVEDWDECSSHTSIQAPNTHTDCGNCIAPGPGAAPCTAGGSYYVYTPYSCSWWPTECVITNKNFMAELGTANVFTQTCWYWYVPKPMEIGTYWPVYYVKGKQQCCNYTATGTFQQVTLPDCD